MLFKTCMDYRRSVVSKDPERSKVFQVYDSLKRNGGRDIVRGKSEN